MPLPGNVRSHDMAGRTVVLAERVTAGVFASLPAGTPMRVEACAGRLTLGSARPCPCCGVSVKGLIAVRDQAFLDGDPAAPPLETLAFWQDRAAYNDFLWSECSNCGFQVEHYKAVETGRSSTDYTRPKYGFCPKCGKPMAVRNSNGEVVT